MSDITPSAATGIYSLGWPSVWCIIPHYGSDTKLDRCLESLKQVDYPHDLFPENQIIVVNHNPPNENKLFTAAVNTGLHIATRERQQVLPGNEAIFWILNNDTIIESQVIKAVAHCFTETGWKQTGIVGSKNVLMEDPDFIYWGGSKQGFPNGLHKTGRVSNGDLSERTEEEWVTFSSVFLNARLVEEIGFLDRNLKHIASDVDYCFRARSQGWKCFYEPQSVIQHEVGTSHQGASPQLMKAMEDDVNFFFKKWVNPIEYFNSLTQYKVRLTQQEESNQTT